MAGAVPTGSSAVASGACSHPIRLAPTPHSICFSVRRSRVSRKLVAFRHRFQENRQIWASAATEVAVDGAANTAIEPVQNAAKESEDASLQEPSVSAKEASISALMADISNLIKLVDTRDIVELELKHQDYELVLKKKEALPPPPVVSHVQPVLQGVYPTYAPPPQPAAPSPPAEPSSPPASAPSPVLKPAAGSSPRILSPMAGTFYKSPAPGEPAFVKVGDKVSKGQVVCIVEAMKLMNEIEADQSGTIVEILIEDGKPVSVDTPLYVIKP